MWQSITTPDLLEIAAQDKAKLGQVLKRWREEAFAVFNICTTIDQFKDVEKRFTSELDQIKGIGKNGAKWAETCLQKMQDPLTKIADRISDNQINERSKIYL